MKRILICALTAFAFSCWSWAHADFRLFGAYQQSSYSPSHGQEHFDHDQDDDHDGDHDDDDHNGGMSCQTDILSTQSAGPANYHPSYAGIQSTKITIQNFQLRGEDGSTVSITTPPMPIDLQALSGTGQGIALSTIGVTLPSNFQLAEIQSDIVSPADASVSPVDGAACALKTPSKINFYTAAPIPLSNDSFLVKVQFSPLNSVQIDVNTITSQNVCCAKECHNRYSSHSSCTTTPLPPQTTVSCELENRRQLITSILGG